MSLRNHTRRARSHTRAPITSFAPPMPLGTLVPGAARTAPGGLFDMLVRDHRRAQQLQAAVESGEIGYFDALRRAILAHAYAEEQTLYNAMLQDPGMVEITQAHIAEHQALAGQLDTLASSDMASPQWRRLFHEAMAAFDQHVLGEEGRAGVPGSYFGAASVRLSPQAQMNLAKQYNYLVQQPVKRVHEVVLPNPRVSHRRRGMLSTACYYEGCGRDGDRIVWCIVCGDGTRIPIPLATPTANAPVGSGGVESRLDRITMWAIRRAALRGKLNDKMIRVLQADIAPFYPVQRINTGGLVRIANQPHHDKVTLGDRVKRAMWSMSGALQVLRDDVAGWYPTRQIRGPWVEVRSGSSGLLHRGRAPAKRVTIISRRNRGGLEEVRIENRRAANPPCNCAGKTTNPPCDCGGC